MADIDAIVIATPNHTHFELARLALFAGKHVVVDKPLTVTARQAHELRDIAHERKKQPPLAAQGFICPFEGLTN